MILGFIVGATKHTDEKANHPLTMFGAGSGHGDHRSRAAAWEPVLGLSEVSKLPPLLGITPVHLYVAGCSEERLLNEQLVCVGSIRFLSA